jgi:hypothetical protein
MSVADTAGMIAAVNPMAASRIAVPASGRLKFIGIASFAWGFFGMPVRVQHRTALLEESE